MFVGTVTVGGGNLFYQWFGMYFPENAAFQPWQIFTHMFMHGGFRHIFFNMFALFMFGVAVEQYLGNKKFLMIYLVSGLGAVLFQVAYYYFDYYSTYEAIASLNMSTDLVKELLSINLERPNLTTGDVWKEMQPIFQRHKFNPNLVNQASFDSLLDLMRIKGSVMVGASGCIMGILVAFAMMNPNAELMLIFLPIPIKAKYFIPGLIALDLISALSGKSFLSPSNTAHMAHIGGALTGFLMMLYWKRTEFNKNRWD